MSQAHDEMEKLRQAGLTRLPAIDPKTDAILLDIDGTLVDIAPTPESVHVPHGLRRSLERLTSCTDGALALVSGRTLQSIDALFAPLKTAAIGCHGAQIRKAPEAASELRVLPLPGSIVRAFSDIALLEPRIRVENKTFALAFHYRQAPDRQEPLLARLIERLTPFESNYILMGGKSIFEIKPRSCTKGEALRVLMRSPAFAGRRPVFFGDDTTDEYAFAVLPEFDGIGVSIGRRMPDAGFTVSEPRDVRLWLATLADHCEE